MCYIIDANCCICEKEQIHINTCEYVLDVNKYIQDNGILPTNYDQNSLWRQ